MVIFKETEEIVEEILGKDFLQSDMFKKNIKQVNELLFNDLIIRNGPPIAPQPISSVEGICAVTAACEGAECC